MLRGGYGIFYDRFSYDYMLQAERFNGTTQQQYIVANPNFYPLIPTPSELSQLATTSPTVYQVQTNLHVPYTMEAAFSVERQVTKNATVSVTYLNSRGIHQLILRNANAPLPGTYNPADPDQRHPALRRDNQHLSVQLGRSLRAEPAHRQHASEHRHTNCRCSASTALSFANSDLGSGGAVSIVAGGGGFGGGFGGGGGGSPQFVMNSYDPEED